MTRKALIISNPGEVGADNYCEGVKKDVVNYKKFLSSPQGGSWFESEITCLEKPSIEILNRQIDSMKSIDYTMIIFCGHGYSFMDETILEVKNDLNIYAYTLKNGAKKRSIILDCCRVRAESIDESIIHEFSAQVRKSKMDWLEARKYYDTLINACHDGIVTTYACDFGETAGDDSRKGGYYSSSLLEAAQKWADRSLYKGSKSIVAVHNMATELTREKSNNLQNPQIDKPRTEPYFPFAVSV